MYSHYYNNLNKYNFLNLWIMNLEFNTHKSFQSNFYSVLNIRFIFRLMFHTIRRWLFAKKIIERKPPKSTMHTGKTICFYQHAWSYCWIVVISTKFLKLYHATKFWFIVLKKNYHYVPVYTNTFNITIIQTFFKSVLFLEMRKNY